MPQIWGYRILWWHFLSGKTRVTLSPSPRWGFPMRHPPSQLHPFISGETPGQTGAIEDPRPPIRPGHICILTHSRELYPSWLLSDHYPISHFICDSIELQLGTSCTWERQKEIWKHGSRCMPAKQDGLSTLAADHDADAATEARRGMATEDSQWASPSDQYPGWAVPMLNKGCHVRERTKQQCLLSSQSSSPQHQNILASRSWRQETASGLGCS